MRCPFCGNESEQGQKNCPKCGEILASSSFLATPVPKEGIIAAIGCLVLPVVIIVVSFMALTITDSFAGLIFPMGLGVFIGALLKMKSKTASMGSLGVILIACSVLCPLFVLSLFYISGDRTSEGSKLYDECVSAIDSIKRADEAYYTKYGKHADNVESLMASLSPYCPDNSACAGNDGKGILNACTDYSIENAATSSIKITARAKDEFHCFVCDPPKYHSQFGTWQCPSATPRECR